MVQITTVVKKLLPLLVVIETVKGISSQDKARIRLNNSIDDTRYYESFYWRRVGEDIYDDDNWQRVGPKYLMDALENLAQLLTQTNQQLQILQELIKAGKVTIINSDGPHFQQLLTGLHTLQKATLLNVNHYEGSLFMNFLNKAHQSFLPISLWQRYSPLIMTLVGITLCATVIKYLRNCISQR